MVDSEILGFLLTQELVMVGACMSASRTKKKMSNKTHRQRKKQRNGDVNFVGEEIFHCHQIWMTLFK